MRKIDYYHKIRKDLINTMRWYQRQTGVCGLVGLQYPYWYPDDVRDNKSCIEYINRMKKQM